LFFISKLIKKKAQKPLYYKIISNFGEK